MYGYVLSLRVRNWFKSTGETPGRWLKRGMRHTRNYVRRALWCSFELVHRSTTSMKNKPWARYRRFLESWKRKKVCNAFYEPSPQPPPSRYIVSLLTRCDSFSKKHVSLERLVVLRSFQSRHSDAQTRTSGDPGSMFLWLIPWANRSGKTGPRTSLPCGWPIMLASC